MAAQFDEARVRPGGELVAFGRQVDREVLQHHRGEEDRMMIRSPRYTDSSMSWVTNRIVTPRRSQTAVSQGRNDSLL